MKSVEHWKQVKACELRPFDVVMIPWHTLVPTTDPKTGKFKKRTVTRYKRAMITSNYLHPQSPYAKLHYTEDTRQITTYTKLDCSQMVWKFVESRVSKVWSNELDKILASNNRGTFFNPLFGADYCAGIRDSVESGAVKRLREFLNC